MARYELRCIEQGSPLSLIHLFTPRPSSLCSSWLEVHRNPCTMAIRLIISACHEACVSKEGSLSRAASVSPSCTEMGFEEVTADKGEEIDSNSARIGNQLLSYLSPLTGRKKPRSEAQMCQLPSE